MRLLCLGAAAALLLVAVVALPSALADPVDDAQDKLPQGVPYVQPPPVCFDIIDRPPYIVIHECP